MRSFGGLRRKLLLLEERLDVQRLANGAPVDQAEAMLRWYRQQGRDGIYDDEPDFPEALASLDAAIENAKRNPEFARDRQGYAWQTVKYRECLDAVGWLDAMLRRRIDGAPTFSLAEFDELAGWYRINEHRFIRDGVLMLPDGSGMNPKFIRWCIDHGPKGGDFPDQAAAIIRAFRGDPIRPRTARRDAVGPRSRNRANAKG